MVLDPGPALVDHELEDHLDPPELRDDHRARLCRARFQDREPGGCAPAGASVGAALAQNGGRRTGKDLEVELERPILDIGYVVPDRLLPAQQGTPAHLP